MSLSFPVHSNYKYNYIPFKKLLRLVDSVLVLTQINLGHSEHTRVMEFTEAAWLVVVAELISSQVPTDSCPNVLFFQFESG